jgi:hypothetical protein
MLRAVGVVQHVFAEIALTAVGARVGVAALNIAVLAAGNILRRAHRDVVGTAECIVVATGVDHGRLSPLKAACKQRCDEQQSDVGPCGVTSHEFICVQLSSLPGLTAQSIEIKASIEKMMDARVIEREYALRAFARA